MKYIFIVNPVAGTGDAMELYSSKIRAACDKKQLDYNIYTTTCPGHATELAKGVAAYATEEEPVRIFAVGGDGTLCEVANGLMNLPNIELGCIPCGTGNDYVKCFGKPEEFFDLDSYITAPSYYVDAISVDHLNAINICSLGLDAKVCDEANRIKDKNKKLKGSKAYDKAMVRCFFGKLYNRLRVTIDDEKVYEGKYLFSLAASGQYYGGGYRGAPMADPTDGLLDFVLIKTVPHIRVPFLVGKYKKGTFVNDKQFKKLLTHVRGKKMLIESKTPAVINVDGECISKNRMTIELMPAALRFIAPVSYVPEHN